MEWSDDFSYVTNSLKQYGYYEKTLKELKSLVKPDFIAVDIGANIGYFTLMLAQLCQQVYSFEPHPTNFKFLQRNVELNNYKNAILYQKAVSEKSGKTKLYISNQCTGMHRIYPSKYCTEQTVDVETVRLDDIIEQADFVKMDVEASEYGVLKGMERLLKNVKVIIMEFVPECILEYGKKPEEVLALLSDFRIKHENNNLVCMRS